MSCCGGGTRIHTQPEPADYLRSEILVSSQRPLPAKGGHCPSSGNGDASLALRELPCTALPQLKVATNLSSMVGHPLPIARRTPDSHTHPCKDRDNRIYIDMAQVETLPCVLERIRQGQRIPSLPYSEAGLPRSDRDSPSYSYDSLCGTPIIRLRLLLIQLADANGAPRSSREAGQSAMCVSGRWCRSSLAKKNGAQIIGRGAYAGSITRGVSLRTCQKAIVPANVSGCENPEISKAIFSTLSVGSRRWRRPTPALERETISARHPESRCLGAEGPAYFAFRFFSCLAAFFSFIVLVGFFLSDFFESIPLLMSLPRS